MTATFDTGSLPAAALAAVPDAAGLPICALCHTLDKTLSKQAFAEGTWWRCGRCGQRWNAERLLARLQFEHFDRLERTAAARRTQS